MPTEPAPTTVGSPGPPESVPEQDDMESSSPTVDLLVVPTEPVVHTEPVVPTVPTEPVVPTEPAPTTVGSPGPPESVPEQENAGGEAKKKKGKRKKKKASQARAGDVFVVEEDPAESAGEPVFAEAKLSPRAEPVCAEAKLPPRAAPRSRAQQAVRCSRVVGAGVAWVMECCSVSWSVDQHVACVSWSVDQHVACVSWSVDQHVACVPWVIVLEREVKEHGNHDNSEPCVELVCGCTTGGCDENVSEPPKVNQHRLCALRGLPVVIPVPDEDEELIPASMPEPVGSEEPTSGPGPELEQPKPDEDPEQELHVPLGDKEYQNIKSIQFGFTLIGCHSS